MSEEGLQHWQFATTHALDKVYPDTGIGSSGGVAVLSSFLGESASFQIAFRPPVTSSFRDTSGLRVSVDPEEAAHVDLREVELVPCDLAAFPGHDQGYERDVPGLYPDLLRPLLDSTITPLLGGWKALWVDFRVDDPALAGMHEVEVTLSHPRSGVLYRTTLCVEVIASELPRLAIVNTHWFHCDGLAQHYGVEVFSERHWQIIEAFLACAVKMQVNTVLTPVWTPPLDTERGGHRLATQLLGISEHAGRYDVDFTLLDRWMELCRRHGIERLEIAHLFSQWGAQATPSIYIQRGGELVEGFGWHVEATDPRYRGFLEQVLPQLTAHLQERWGLERVLFHLSDEPSGPEGLAGYLRAKAVVGDLLASCTVIDALSNVEFYDSGAVALPVVATDALAPFLQRQVEPLWVYYCVNQDRAVSNRFFALPSARNRVIGHQLFAYGCAGFLHWGFNFYNSDLSRRPVDPFRDTTASGALLGGDAFMVYPGPDGQPLESVRSMVFTQAMFDLRALHHLTALAGRQAVMDLVDTDGCGGPLRFEAYNDDPLHYLRVRRSVNAQIRALSH